MSVAGRFRKLMFGISPTEATFARRGFRADDPLVQARLERIGATFINGYLAALEAGGADHTVRRLQAVENEICGFAYEGAAMGLALLDWLTPWNGRRIRGFLAGDGGQHVYMVHVGIGWAAARLPWVRRNIERLLQRFDPLLRWLVIDGFGFHEGYFHGQRYFEQIAEPKRLSAEGRRVFDQGLGRSLWFVAAAEPGRIEAAIAKFPPPRRADLWSGIGLACAYAGGVDREAIAELRAAAGTHRAELAQGAAFAAKARQRAGNLTQHTEIACQVLCGRSATAAAAVADDCLANLVDAVDYGGAAAYQRWRRRIQQRLAVTELERAQIV